MQSLFRRNGVVGGVGWGQDCGGVVGRVGVVGVQISLRQVVGFLPSLRSVVINEGTAFPLYNASFY